MSVIARFGLAGCALLMVVSAGCREYEITQFDNVPARTFQPKTYRRAAIVTHRARDDEGDRSANSLDHNKLILEAFQVELMRRGLDVVEREKFERLVNEQLLIRGELTNLSDREKAIRIGKILNVDVVFYADALINSSRYVYEKSAFGSKARALELTRKATESGVVEGVGKYKIHAYHDVGVTARAIDARTGEIVWVGYRVLAVCEEVTEDSPTALTSFATIKRLCGMVLDDFFTPLPAPITTKG
ncbi:MAG: hypothetical protein JSV19_12960 [Phycisphaerales bacterium]|nr:MAG: hypothetical protein JSV19_12960 [Phycisphaerales bacterium]